MSDGHNQQRRDEAARWMARSLSDDFTGADHADIDAWLRSDVTAQREWDTMQRLWRMSGDVTAHRIRNESGPVSSKSQNRAWLSAAAAALLVVITGAVLPQASGRWGNPDNIVIAERTTTPVQIHYDDGTIAMVDKGTEIGHRFSKRSREVRLADGRAFFEIARDRNRPFIVYSNGSRITALGTAFDVQVADEAITVTLLHGKVAITPPDDTKNSLILRPGERAVITESKVLTSRIDIRDIDAWSNRKHLLRNVSLIEAARIINRYAAKPIIVAPALASIHSSGVFNFGDSEAFAKAVSTIHPEITIHDDGLSIRLDQERHALITR